MSALAADLAHKLNQPLSATTNCLAAARMLTAQGMIGERIADLLRMGKEQTQHSGEIIRRLRNLLPSTTLRCSPESLYHVVREAVDLVLFGASPYAVQLSYDLDPASDQMFANRIQVQQVLVNLLRNVVDALRGQPVDGSPIVVASRRVDGEGGEVSVRDTGPGLPDAIVQQFYVRFATTERGSGMGIGLSISRRIVEAHGRTLVAQNRPEGRRNSASPRRRSRG